MASGARCEILSNASDKNEKRPLITGWDEQTEFYHNNSTVINVCHSFTLAAALSYHFRNDQLNDMALVTVLPATSSRY